jgi:hypothetical protein
MNVKIGTEAVQFPEKEYINGIFLAVNRPWNIIEEGNILRSPGGEPSTTF